MDESKVFTSSVAPVVSKSSDSAPINGGIASSASYSAMASDTNNTDPNLYDLDAFSSAVSIQSTVEQSLASATALSNSQSFGQRYEWQQTTVLFRYFC